ncbi:MAG: PadR family transcriptional regulator [Chloroflexi bacterium]|nr:PadR family transcriptional regulator [Chloroflexota bacterium]
MAGMMNARFFLLGLLDQRPMSGYDIKRYLKSLEWLIGSPSFGSLYPSLHALLDQGLVTVEIASRSDKPPRKQYSITDAGRLALQEWADRPIFPRATLKDFVMVLMLAGNLTLPRVAAHLEQRRAQVATQRAVLERELHETSGQMTDSGERLALDYGLALATAELAWLDATLGDLAEGDDSATGPLQGNAR